MASPYAEITLSSVGASPVGTTPSRQLSHEARGLSGGRIDGVETPSPRPRQVQDH